MEWSKMACRLHMCTPLELPVRCRILSNTNTFAALLSMVFVFTGCHRMWRGRETACDSTSAHDRSASESDLEIVWVEQLLPAPPPPQPLPPSLLNEPIDSLRPHHHDSMMVTDQDGMPQRRLMKCSVLASKW